MNRRQFLRLGGAGVAAAAWPGLAAADVECAPFHPMTGSQQCVAGLRSPLAATFHAHQRQSQWCWAACIQMVFRHRGYVINQPRIVHEAWGTIANQPASAHDIMRSLNRRWRDDRGRRFRAMADTYSANPVTAAQDLARNQPLILGTLGHAMVLTALHYERDPYGGGRVTLATVRDPWPRPDWQGGGRRHLSAHEWYQTRFLARISVLPG